MAEKPIIGFVNSIVEAPSPSSTPPASTSPASTSPQAIGAGGPPAPRRSIVRFRVAEDADPTDDVALIDPESDTAARNIRLLQGLMHLGAPAYVERTPDRVISNVLTPTIGRVVAIHDAGEDKPLRVQLDNSSASHFIARSNATEPSIALLRESMEAGKVLLVTQDRQKAGIIDVRLCPEEWAASAPRPEPSEEPPEGPETALIATLTPKTLDEIEDLFQTVQQLTCPVDNSEFGCLPFLYAEDGCRARAHRMCELFQENHTVETAKIWVFADSTGPLKPKTRNLKECHASWEVHVAPVVRVAGTDTVMVIDPSMFDKPVTRATFVAAMNHPHPSVGLTERAIYFKVSLTSRGRLAVPAAGASLLDETLTQLERFRVLLEVMYPAPPFQHCQATP